MKRLEVVVGMKIGEYTVIEDLREAAKRHVKVRCSCGRVYVRDIYNLVSIANKGGCPRCRSCSNSEINRKSKVKHGDARHGHEHPLFRLWVSIKQRCTDPNCWEYANYGGRGITICEEWEHDYLAFKSWAIKAGWRKGFQIDREDNERGYSPDNCRFVTGRENTNNRRCTKYIDGIPCAVWFENHEHNPSVTYRTFFLRYWRRHWDLERSLLTPVRPRIIGG